MADRLFNDPPKEPIGVLVALTMNTSLKAEDVDIHRLATLTKHYFYIKYILLIYIKFYKLYVER